eukprot:4462898-Lingulodinium_polyedra.AAC.1
MAKPSLASRLLRLSSTCSRVLPTSRQALRQPVLSTCSSSAICSPPRARISWRASPSSGRRQLGRLSRRWTDLTCI